jgi:hypothetical protein
MKEYSLALSFNCILTTVNATIITLIMIYIFGPLIFQRFRRNTTTGYRLLRVKKDKEIVFQNKIWKTSKRYKWNHLGRTWGWENIVQ